MKKLLTILATALTTTCAMAGTRSFNLSLIPDIAVYDRGESIEGLTLSIWGENHQRSLALGIVNGSTGNSSGLSWAYALNYADDYDGVQLGLVNYTHGDFLGWQHGVANYSGDEMRGLQSGFVNYAGQLTGLQFGFVNFAESADAGVQIGILNVIRENTRWFGDLPDELAPAMVFVNWRF